MGKEHRTRTFKSGNSVALRLPKWLGIAAGEEMTVREDHGDFILGYAGQSPRHISLSGIAGAAADMKRMPVDEIERDWSMRP